MVTKGTTRSRKDLEFAILDSARACVDAKGFDEVTIDDVCEHAGVSRATLYRVFPGGRDVLFEALRCVVVATTELKHDEQLAVMLATSPGETLGDLTVNGMSRIVRVATDFFVPLVKEFVSEDEARVIVELMVRLVISFFLAPSPTFDCTNEHQVQSFIRAYVPHTTSHNQRSRS
jgi:AcrR family transcriptional regulator